MVMLVLAMRCDAMRCDAIEEACGIRVVDGMGNNITCGVTAVYFPHLLQTSSPLKLQVCVKWISTDDAVVKSPCKSLLVMAHEVT